MNRNDWLEHAKKGVQWKNHKYTGFHFSKSGKKVYEYPGDTYEDDNKRIDKQKYRNYNDNTIFSKNGVTFIRNKKSNVENGYGTTTYEYEKKNTKTGAVEKGTVKTTVKKGNTWFTKKVTMKIGNSTVTDVRTGKLRQSAEKGMSWLSKKFKKRK